MTEAYPLDEKAPAPRCPSCGSSRKLRIAVNLFLDIPASLAHRLSKTRLRSGEVKVTGAGWPSALYYCACGWMEKHS